MRRLTFCLLFATSALASTSALGAARIAVVAPQSGNLQILGQQVLQGAELAAGTAAEIVAIDETCADNSGPAIAEQIRQAGAVAAIGFLCSQSLEGALPSLAEARIPAITLSVRASILMEDSLRKGWPLYRLAPAPAAERDKIVETIFRNWKGKPFAILDDGTITSRETADAVREALEQKGMKATHVDNFRPAQEVQTLLMRRLAKAGVTHIYAAADRGDMAIMVRDAKQAGLPLTFLGGDALNATEQPVPLEKGVLAVTLPDYQALPAAKSAVDVLLTQGIFADGYTLPAYAAVTIVVEGQEIAGGSGASLPEALVDTPFETVLGEIRFTAAHELAENPFRLLEWSGERFEPADETQ